VRWWNRIRGDFLGAFRTGECTDWAARMRPDIIAAVEEHAYSTWSAHPRGTPRAVTQWQAHNWVNYATWAGLPTGHRPRVGAVLVLQPHVLGAGPVGHVAYVVHVAPNGAFTVSGMRQPLAGRVTDWKLPASAARRRGVSFIYRGR
jgi:surface antigen